MIFFFQFDLIAGIIIFLSSFLIDIDHYFWYGATTKDWNPLNAIYWYNKKSKKLLNKSEEEKRNIKKGVFIFHSLPLLLILGIFTQVNIFVSGIFLGFLFHISLDLIAQVYYNEPLYVKLFPCLTIKRNKNKKSLKSL